MNVNLDLLKEKYLDYKIEKGEKPENSEAVNIYDAEFKTFLVDEMGADSSIFQKGMDEILNMSIEDGKLVDNSKNNQNNDNSLILQALDSAQNDAQNDTQAQAASENDSSDVSTTPIVVTTSKNAMMGKASTNESGEASDEGFSDGSEMNAATDDAAAAQTTSETDSKDSSSGFSDGTTSNTTNNSSESSSDTSSDFSDGTDKTTTSDSTSDSTSTDNSPVFRITSLVVWKINNPSLVSTSVPFDILKSKSRGFSTENLRVVFAEFASSFVTPKGSPMCSRLSRFA